MIDQSDLKKIKEITEEFLQKMTVAPLGVTISQSLQTAKEDNPFEENFLPTNTIKKGVVRLSYATESKGENAVLVDINAQDPQFLIGQGGQTLFDLQRLLKIILNKKLQKPFYVRVDINGYKEKKIAYLKNLARDLAGEVAFSREERVLAPMSSYERRIMHMELQQRNDVKTESRGNGPDRRLVIKPK